MSRPSRSRSRRRRSMSPENSIRSRSRRIDLRSAPPRRQIIYDDSNSDYEDNDSDDVPVLESLGIQSAQLESLLSSIDRDGTSKETHSSQSRAQSHSKLSDHIRGVSSYNIMRSKYTGEGVAGGFQSVELTVSEGSAGRGAFQWFHFEPTTMHFGEFQQQVLDTLSLTDDAKKGVAKVCKRIPKKFKLVAKGAHTSHASIEPGFLEESFMTDSSSSADTRLERKVIRFWCLPFLFLGKYAGNRLAIQTGPKPMSTLLQTRYDGVSEARDKLQASCQVLGAESQLSFHVPQLWCLTIDDDILITCAQIPHKLLRGDVIEMITHKLSVETPEIRVIYGANTVWRLLLARCETWFDLISNFWEFWLNDFKIYCSGKLVDSESWPKLYAAAKKAGSLKLTFQLGKKRNFQAGRYIARTVQRLQVISPDFKSTLVGDVSNSTSSKPLHSLVQLARTDNNGLGARSLDASAPFSVLKQILLKIDQHLNVSTSASDGQKELSAYKKCKTISFRNLQDQVLLQQSGVDSSEISHVKPARIVAQERQIELLSLVETLVEMFVPLDVDATCVCKIWGAIYGLIELEESQDPDELHLLYDSPTEYLTKLIEPLRKVAARSTILLELVSWAPRTDLRGTMLFNSLVQAFLQLILFLVNLDARLDNEMAAWKPYYRSFMKYVDTATEEFVRGLQREPLLQSTIISPLDVGQLISTQVLKDVTNGQPDVRTIYKTYIGQLDDQINTDSSQRTYQQSLLLLRQEVETLKFIFSKQYDIISAMSASTSRDESRPQMLDTYKVEKADFTGYDRYGYPIRNAVKFANTRNRVRRVNTEDLKVFGRFDDTASTLDRMSAADPDGFRRVFANESLQLIQERQEFFDALSERIEHLDLLNDRKFSASADRRDLAVYAFAIVTIIFLPISTIAAIFSISADNIPSLGSIQPLFWSVAAPLSVAIIFGGLLWAGELGNTWRGFISWLTQQQFSAYSAKHGYAAKSSMIKKGGEDAVVIPASVARDLFRTADSRLNEGRDRNYSQERLYDATGMRRRANYQSDRGRYEDTRYIF